MESLLPWVSLLLAPLTGIVTWITSRHKRIAEMAQVNGDAIAQMQKTIDELVSKNAELYSMVTALHQENLNLQLTIKELKTEIEYYNRITKL